jgi:hypothetical protein
MPDEHVDVSSTRFNSASMAPGFCRFVAPGTGRSPDVRFLPTELISKATRRPSGIALAPKTYHPVALAFGRGSLRWIAPPVPRTLERCLGEEVEGFFEELVALRLAGL